MDPQERQFVVEYAGKVGAAMVMVERQACGDPRSLSLEVFSNALAGRSESFKGPSFLAM